MTSATPSTGSAIRLDNRTNDELRHEALAPSRSGRCASRRCSSTPTATTPTRCELLARPCSDDPDREVRWDALWAIEKLGGAARGRARCAVHRPMPTPRSPSGPAVRQRAADRRPGVRRARPPVHAGPHVRRDDLPAHPLRPLRAAWTQSNTHWGKISLAPQGLARVYGQAHACPNVATRERQLVIAKTIYGLHQDGSPHIDNYLFRGFTDRTRRDRGNFFFESHVPRTVLQVRPRRRPRRGSPGQHRLRAVRHLAPGADVPDPRRAPRSATSAGGSRAGATSTWTASPASHSRRCSPRATACCRHCTTPRSAR